MVSAGLSKKQRAAQAALQYLSDGMIIGVGTGTTVNALIEFLGRLEHAPERRGLELRGIE